ncbi:MAG: alpha/beta hydrolase [Chitinophagaceae bacterium]
MAKTYAPPITSTKGHSVVIGSIEMYYEEYGAGKPLLLLHGFGGCSQNWHPFTDRLAEEYRLIVVDLRGHGYSTNPGNKFTHQEAAGDVFLLLEKLGIDHFSAMGMSTGGMTLLHMARSQPGRIDSMVLISTTTYFPDQARAIMRRASFDTMPPEVREMYRECAKRGEEQIRGLIAQFNAFCEDYDDMNFTEQSLSIITARTLVVHGERDNFFPIEIAENIYRSIPGATLWIIPGGDHVPIYDPVVPFTSTALQFLDEANSK